MSIAKPLVNPAEGLIHPTKLVMCPRAMRDFYWHMPWADVCAAAETQKDGLSFWDFNRETNPLCAHGNRPPLWQGDQMGEARPPDVAFLAEGLNDFKGRTVLYQQNYSDKGQQ